MNDGKKEPQVQHKWLWAISPLDSNVVFAAHCRQCNQYYTQKLVVFSSGPKIGQVDLPEWGCKVPEGF